MKRTDALEEESRKKTGNESESTDGGGKGEGKKKGRSAAEMNPKNTRGQSKSGNKKSKVTDRLGRSHRMSVTGGVGEHLGFLRDTGGRPRALPAQRQENKDAWKLKRHCEECKMHHMVSTLLKFFIYSSITKKNHFLKNH